MNNDKYSAKFARKLLPLAIAASVGAVAQEQNSEQAREGRGAGVFEEVIVTGTPGGQGVRRVDAAFSIDTQSAEDIKKFAPKTTADLLKSVPGVWVESSGGGAGANIQVRGLPSPGDAPFVTVAVNGSAVYPASLLSFFENTSLFYIDETVERMEALRGGPNPVYANGQPGLTTNFILKEGSDEFEGLLKYTGSSYDLNRIDFMASGALTDDLYYMVGGYRQSSPGIRDTEFTSEDGEQITFNITKVLDNGKINFYTRITDQANAFYVPIPIGNDEQDGVPGFDPGTGTYHSNDLRFASIARYYDPVSGEIDMQTFDLADGRSWNGSVSGINLELDLGDGWSLRNNLGVTEGDANTIGLFAGTTNTLGVFLADGDGVADSGATGTVISTGETLDDSGLVTQVGFWAVEKAFKSFSNDLSLSWETDKNSLTFGLYVNNYSADDLWSLGNNFYVTVEENSQRVDVVNGAGDAVTSNGQYSGAFAAFRQVGDASTQALYIADTFNVTEDFSINAGVRFITDYTIEYAQDNGVSVDRDGDPATTFDVVNAPDGIIDRTEKTDLSDETYVVGFNWNFADNQGVFGNLNSGFLLPSFQDQRGTNPGQDAVPLEVDQAELGYKLALDNFQLFATAFTNESTQLQFSISNNQQIVTSTETETFGVELDGAFYAGEFSLAYNLTYQDAEITASSNAAIVGNQPQRIPELQFRLAPSYTIDLGDASDLAVYGGIRWVDDRFGNNQNNQEIESFTKVDFGALWNVNESLSVQLAVDNVFDEVGLTEANPRVTTAQSGVRMGRPIFGRTTKLSFGYKF